MARSALKRFAPIWLPLLVLIILPAALVGGYMVRFGYDPQEAWLAVRHFSESGTRYGQGFEERNFAAVRQGMRGDEVHRLLGQPMEGHLVDGKPGRVWRFSLPQPGKTWFHERAILFDLPPGKPPVVSGVWHRFHSADLTNEVP
ncbi:MAG: hypothetical protein KDK99_06760 [Verrucomicrobiales bacterium]|nr:hypothetical protein [Verrucomicrobiales bacterium]